MISTLRFQDIRLRDRWRLNSTYLILDDIPSQPKYLKHINSVEMSLLMCNLLQIGAASLISTLRIHDFMLGDRWCFIPHTDS